MRPDAAKAFLTFGVGLCATALAFSVNDLALLRVMRGEVCADGFLVGATKRPKLGHASSLLSNELLASVLAAIGASVVTWLGLRRFRPKRFPSRNFGNMSTLGGPRTLADDR